MTGVKDYDPDRQPDATVWLGLSEQRRLDLILAFHERMGIQPPRPKTHAALHAMVENQIAENWNPAVNAVKRLINEGLTRHEAIHAACDVLLQHMSRLLGPEHPKPTNDDLGRALDELTRERWYSSYTTTSTS